MAVASNGPAEDGLYDVFSNPPIRDSEPDFDLIEDDKYECPVCGAPFGSCMDIIFEPGFGEPDND